MSDDLEPRLREFLEERAPGRVPPELMDRVRRVPASAPAHGRLLGTAWPMTRSATSAARFAMLAAALLGLLLLALGMLAVGRPAPLVLRPVHMGSLLVTRDGPGVAMLPDGRVLLAGGYDPKARRSSRAVDTYDPVTGELAALGTMHTPRANPVTAVLPDGGVLLAGGADDPTTAPEYLDLASGTFLGLDRSTRSIDAVHMATLADGDVLLATSSTLVRYEVASRAFTTLAEVFADALVELPDGTILVIGWDADADGSVPAWLLGPGETRLTSIGSVPGVQGVEGTPDAGTAMARHGLTGVTLPDGRVLLTGGYVSSGDGPVPVRESLVFDPADHSFRPGPSLLLARSEPAVIGLPDGRVMVAGGEVAAPATATGLTPTDAVEIIDVTTGRVVPAPAMSAARRWLTGTVLHDGSLLLVGTDPSDGPSGERYPMPAGSILPP